MTALQTGDSCGRRGVTAALYNASEPRSTLDSEPAHRRILSEVNRSLELNYGFLVIGAVLGGAGCAYVVGALLMAGWVAAGLAGLGGFVLGLGVLRRFLLGPAKRRARVLLAALTEPGSDVPTADLSEWPLVQAVWAERAGETD